VGVEARENGALSVDIRLKACRTANLHKRHEKQKQKQNQKKLAETF
jgi:hypothetical protein